MRYASVLNDIIGKIRPDNVWHGSILKKELNGGRVTIDEIDNVLDCPHVTALTVSGLNQETFEYLIRKSNGKISAYYFWKCPQIVDLSPLESVEKLSHVALFWNPILTKFWNFGKNLYLKGLYFDDLNKLTSLSDLSRARSLVELSFGNKVFNKCVFDSLGPLINLSNLEYLGFNSRKITDGKVAPIGSLEKIKNLSMPSNLFSVRQLAWLRWKLGESVISDQLSAISVLKQPFRRGEKLVDTRLNGKGMPILSSSVDSKRIRDHVEKFNQFVCDFKANETLNPDEI